MVRIKTASEANATLTAAFAGGWRLIGFHILETNPAGESLVERHAERVDVRPRANLVRLSLDLLGRGVVGRTSKLAGECQRGKIHVLGHAEIQ